MTLRRLVIAMSLTLSSLASAQTPVVAGDEPADQPAPTPPEPAAVEKMMQGARNMAREGRCDALAIIARRVWELDQRYYGEVFAVDPVIKACVQGQRAPELELPRTVAPPSPSGLTVEPAEETRPLPRGGYKSPGTALALSGGLTSAGILMWFVAARAPDDTQLTLGLTGTLLVVVGPTTGHIYAGNGWNTGLKWRLGSLGVATAASIGALAACPPLSRCENEGAASVLAIIALGAGATHLGATIYEVATAGDSARKYNRSHDVSIGVAPMVGREPGIAVVGRF